MKILLVGALSWNPERIRSLHEHGHALWGLWSRSMAWDQGPYPSLEGSVRQVALRDAARTIRDEGIDCVYGLLQAYDRRLWGPPAPGVEHGVWTLLRTLLPSAGAVPSMRRSCGTGGSTSTTSTSTWRCTRRPPLLQPGEARLLDAPVAEGGCGLDLLEDCGVVGSWTATARSSSS